MVKEENLPEGWEMVPLKMVVDFLDKKRVPLSKKERDKINGEYPYYGASGIVDYVNDYIFDNELVLVGEDGQNLISRNKPMAFKASGKIWVNNHAHVLKPLDINIDFLIYQMNLIDYDPFITGSAQPKLNQKKLAEIPIKKPSLKTQQKIVEILEKAEKLKEWRAEADVLTDEYLKSVFLEMFGDPVKNPKGWEINKISSFVKTILSGWSVGGESRIKKDDELGVLKISAVTTGEFLPNEYKVVNKDLIKKELVHPMKGDILFSRANTKELVAAVCIVDKDRKDLFLPDKLWKIVLDENKVNPFYFKNVLSNEAYRNELRKKATGTSGSMLNISKKKLLNTNFPIPPIELQNQFAETVKKVEQIKAQQKQSKQQIDNLFNALMQKAFKGELKC